MKEEVSDLEKELALLEKELRDTTLQIPNPSLFDQGYDRVAFLVTAGEVRSMEAEDQLPPVIKLRESWTNLPIRGRVNPEDREDPRAVEFKRPPTMALEPGQEGVWLARPMSDALPDEELVGLKASVAPKDWEKPASLLEELKLQEAKDPGLVFHYPTTLKVQPYETIFGQDLKEWTLDEFTEDREQDEVKEWTKQLNGKDMRYKGRTKRKFYHNLLLQLGDANMAKAKAEEAEAKAKEAE